MKSSLSIMLIALSIFILSGCSEDDSNPTSSSGSEQFVLTWLHSGYEWKQEPETYFSGFFIGNPTPQGNYYKLNDYYYNLPENFDYEVSGCELDLTANQYSNLYLGNSVNFELNTSLGTVTGNQTKPTLIHNLQVNGEYPTYSDWEPEAYVDLGSNVVLNWTYESEKPDFLYIYADYYWYNSVTDEYEEIYYNEYIPNTTASYILFNGYQVSHNGNMYLGIESVNILAP